MANPPDTVHDMARRINWDAANRQEKLRKWIRDHGSYSWIDELPPHESHELDKWAKRQVQRSVRKVRSRIREQEKIKSTVSGQVTFMLESIADNLESGSSKVALRSAETLLNLVISKEITSIESDLRQQIVETLGLLLIATSDQSG